MMLAVVLVLVPVAVGAVVAAPPRGDLLLKREAAAWRPVVEETMTIHTNRFRFSSGSKHLNTEWRHGRGRHAVSI